MVNFLLGSQALATWISAMIFSKLPRLVERPNNVPGLSLSIRENSGDTAVPVAPAKAGERK
jgi:hypothetical protein